MNIFGVFSVALALCADSFAVSAAGGCTRAKIPWRNKIAAALCFAFCQSSLTLAGWFAGENALSLFENVLKIAAFVLLVCIGVKMCCDAFRNGEVCDENFLIPLNIKMLFMLGIATSIDAFALGVSFAFIGVDITETVAVIFATTVAVCLAGIQAGRAAAKVSKRLPALGGAVLIVIAFLAIL